MDQVGGCRDVCEGGMCIPRLGSSWRSRTGLYTFGMECGPVERSYNDKVSNETKKRRWCMSSRCSMSHGGLLGEPPTPSGQALATMFVLNNFHPLTPQVVWTGVNM